MQVRVIHLACCDPSVVRVLCLEKPKSWSVYCFAYEKVVPGSWAVWPTP
jgi:hypothetical protein